MHIKLERPTLSRRTFLRGAGITLSLPWLEVMSPLARAATTAGGTAAGEAPKRAIFTMWGLGINGRDYTPKDTGLNYTATPILQPLQEHRKDFTVVSGLKLTHSGGHNGDRTFLTGTNTHEAGCKLRVSCDQELADALGRDTRFRSLVLGIRRGTGFGDAQDNTLSWTRNGTPLPAENRPHVLFDMLFRPDTPASLAQREAEFDRRASVLDSVREEAREFESTLGKADRTKMDEYLTGIRDLEKSMQEEKSWLHKPKPNVEEIDFGTAQGIDPDKTGLDYRKYQRLMFDIIALALQTDSTRVVSYQPRMDNSDGTGAYKYRGNPYGYHEMTHHGEDPDKLKWFTQSDIWYMEEWSYFLGKLKSIKEGQHTLLDNCLVAYGSSGGTINAHNRENLPAMLAGGAALGLKHQGHITSPGDYLGNLWQTIFTALGAKVPDNFQGGEASGILKPML